MDMPIMIGNNNERHKTTPNIAVTLKRLFFITIDFVIWFLSFFKAFRVFKSHFILPTQPLVIASSYHNMLQLGNRI